MGKRIPTEKVQKLIVRMPNYLGDSIMTSPAIKLLMDHYPNAKFTIVCKSPFQDVFKELPSLEKIIIDNSKSGGNRFLKTLRLIREIKKERYDIGFLFQNSLSNAIIYRLCRIKNLVGYNNDSRGFLLDYSYKLDRSIHYSNRFARLVNKYLNNKYKLLPELQIWNDGEHPEFNFENKLPVLTLSLGNDSQKSRAYPKDLSWRLIKMLINSGKYNLVFVGDKNDAIRNDEYVSKLSIEEQKYVRNYSGKTEVGTHINIIKSSDLLITVDSSGMHIAAAYKVPFIVILGRSTSPFSTVKPKINIGRYLKNENGLIDDDEFIAQIKPSYIMNELDKVFQEELAEI